MSNMIDNMYTHDYIRTMGSATLTHNHVLTHQYLCSIAITVHRTTEQQVINCEYEFILPPPTPATSPRLKLPVPLLSVPMSGSVPPGPPPSTFPMVPEVSGVTGVLGVPGVPALALPADSWTKRK